MARKSYVKADEIQVKGNKIFSPVRQKWLPLTPEERVRQEYLRVLTQEYGYVTDLMAEEMDVTGRGSAQARADFVIWRSAQDKIDQKPPFIIVECKSDNVTIKAEDYAQGEHYARMTDAPFFVTHNSRETKYWRVKKDKMPGYIEEIENIPHVDATDKEIEELFSKLRVFKEKEFADLLHQCHNVIRNREKKDPAAAFDEIAKILFVKVYVERKLLTRRSKENLFTVDVLDKQIAENPLDNLFQETKKAYTTDKIFEDASLLRVRHFVEDRAYLKAVVSLPQETFISSGASVKASLLFLQKYTDEEKERFDKTYADAKAEIEAEYADEIDKETRRLEDGIAQAKASKDADRRMALQKELREYLKQMDEKKADESRQLLKERFDYPIFMYEAEKVGISATGGEDENELYRNPKQPTDLEKTCVEWYREFLANPKFFTDAGDAVK